MNSTSTLMATFPHLKHSLSVVTFSATNYFLKTSFEFSLLYILYTEKIVEAGVGESNTYPYRVLILNY